MKVNLVIKNIILKKIGKKKRKLGFFNGHATVLIARTLNPKK